MNDQYLAVSKNEDRDYQGSDEQNGWGDNDVDPSSTILPKSSPDSVTSILPGSNAKKEKNKPKRPTKQEYNQARLEFMEMYGNIIKSEQIWRMLAFLCIFIALVAVVGVIYMGSRSHIVPYIVEVDVARGVATAHGAAEKASPVDQRITKAMLGRFITNLRSVSLDAEVQRNMVFEAFDFLSNNSSAKTFLSEHYQQKTNSPFERAKDELVHVEIRSIMPISNTSWALEWTETIRTRQGQITRTEAWKAMATVVISPPQDDRTIYRNPIGLYVQEISWAKQLRN